MGIGPQKYPLAVLFVLFALFFVSSASGQSVDPQQSMSAEQYHQAGVSHYDLGEYEKAIESYKRALELKPDFGESYYYLGMAYGSLGKYKEAINAYNRAVAIRPAYAAAYHNLGHAYSNLKKYEKAIWALRKAIHYEPENIEAYFALGNAYFDSGKEAKAFDTFEAAIQREPDNPYSYYKLGLLYLPAGLYARAMDAFTQAISRDPRYADAYFNRAYTYLFLGRGESAAADARTYLALKGWRDEQSLDMAIVAHLGHLEAHQEEAARKIVEEAVREGDAEAWPYLAVEYLLGNISARVLVGLAEDARKVEARAYVGAKLSLEGDQKNALDHLKWAREHSRAGSLTFALAVSRMDRIKAISRIAP